MLKCGIEVKRILTLVLFLSLMSGCAVKVNTKVTMPANEAAVLKYRTVAVFPFKSQQGEDYTSKIEAVVVSPKENGKSIFTTVDRENMDKIMKEQHFQMSLADPNSMVEMGKLLGVEAMWTGSADSSYSESKYTEERLDCSGKGDNCRRYTVNCIKKSVSIDLTPKLISTSTGKIVYSNRLSEQVSANMCSDDSGQVTKNELEAKALEKVLASFRRDIAPYEQDVNLELMKDTEGISDKDSKKLFEDGVGFAKDARLERACDAWNKVSEKNPNAIAAVYNRALCFEVKGDYESALKVLEKLEALVPPSGFFAGLLDKFSLKSSQSKLVKDAIDRNKKRIDDREKLKAQKL